jgi:hypothetical protein
MSGLMSAMARGVSPSQSRLPGRYPVTTTSASAINAASRHGSTAASHDRVFDLGGGKEMQAGSDLGPAGDGSQPQCRQ